MKPKPGKAANLPSDSQPETIPSDNAVAVKSKKTRKRAADFMDDDEAAADSDGGVKIEHNVSEKTEDEPVKKKAKKKSKKSKDGESLTADGVNGVIEHTGNEELETATTHKPVSTSMQAEAERTVDHELENGFGGFASEDEDDAPEVEVDDNAAVLLAGFDDDDEDEQKDEGVDLTKVPVLPKSRKIQKKLEKAKAKEDDGPGSIYVGRIPHGFYEKQMKEYFSQFGDITKLRLARNKRSGASKHYAFIEFASDSVAKITAEAMDNYLMFGHILKCKYAEPGSLHPDIWKGANKKFRKIPHDKLERERLAAPKTEEKWQKKVDKEQRKRNKKAEQMKSIGLDMPSSMLTNPSTTLKQALADQEKPAEIEEGRDVSPAAIELPEANAQDEVSAKEAKKSKKEKKSKKGKKGDADAIPEEKAAVDELTLLGAQENAPLSIAGDAKAETKTTTSTKKIAKVEKKALSKTKKAAKKAAESAIEDSEAPVVEEMVVEEKVEETVEEDPAPQGEAQTELSADFISLGQFDDLDGQDTSGDKSKKGGKGAGSAAGAKNLKPWKVKKPKKERKNLVKARGPKSKLVSTKPKPDPNATGKIPGLPLMGKGKYDKATREAHKALKRQIVADRKSKGLPPHRVRGEVD